MTPASLNLLTMILPGQASDVSPSRKTHLNINGLTILSLGIKNKMLIIT